MRCQADFGVGSEVGRFSRRVEALLAEPGAKMAVLSPSGRGCMGRRASSPCLGGFSDPSEGNGAVAKSASDERNGPERSERWRVRPRAWPNWAGSVPAQ